MVSPLRAGAPGGAVIMHVDVTARKLAELALRASEQQFSSAFQFAPIGIALVSREGRIMAVNRALCLMLGYVETELLTKHGHDITHPDDLARELANVRRLLDGRTNAFQMEKRYIRKDGQQAWALLSVSLIRNEAGDPVHFISQVQDLTEQRKASQEQRFQAHMLDQIGQAVISTDLAGTIIFANRFAGELYGWAPNEMLGHSIMEVTVTKATQAQAEAIMEKLRRGESWRGEFIVRNRDGREFPAQITNSHILDETGQLAGIVGVSTDISERKQDESRLVASERRFRRLVESNAQGVLFWTAAGRITDANDALLDMLGFTRADLERGSLSWIALTPPEYAGLDTRAVAEVAAHGVCAPYEKEFLGKDGRRVPVLIAGARVDDAPDQGVAFVTDLTERKKLEKQFLRAQRMESIGTLAGGIAHDLNNVLAPILMGIELLKESNTSSDAQEMLATIETSAKRGADLVRQVLSFARGVDGVRVHVTMAHLMRDLLKVMRDTFPKSIDIHLESTSDLWVVAGDPTQLHQVFMNLCVNARDAMPHGGHLQLTMENVVLDDTYTALNPDAHAGAYVLVKVVDTGSGIPPEMRDKVFEPFYTTKEIGKGTGLGLSTTMAIVKSHGGFINLYSELGRGTKFKVYLPANTTAESAEDVAAAQSGLPRGHGELVLVVDDEDAVRDIAQRTLERYGYRVVLAANGAEAVAVYARQQADVAVVLTDMAMPIMDGPALIVALRSINPEVKIIGSSGLASNGGVARAIGAGVPQFVPKPYTARVLLTTLRKAIDGELPA